MAEVSEVSPVTYEELSAIEDEFDQVDSEIMRQQYELSKGAYAKRAEAIAKIPNFWPLVLEQAPPEIDGYIHPEDSRILGESLLSLEVTRPELDIEPQGSPRSISIKFHFKENDRFSDEVLEKKFFYRRASDGWVGLVSEPVKINWKKGKDLTEGLTDGAYALFEARKKTGDMLAKGVPEYAALKKKVEHWNGGNTSFFTWFGWEHQARREARKKGEKVELRLPEPEDEEKDDDDSDVEVHENGDDLAVSFAEDIWPNAIKFFTQAQEMGELSDADFEDDDMEEVEAIDIRALVDAEKRKRLSDGPPAKKQKK
ncbi:uncharacterized protein MYCFIDRAFT_139273 [Pseudocercospora fijiensis CIRAD86]|uniref:Nucleosome assembly protein n=1 Tax=Pseudocercospora fijiensis (strain CIRAD86) TaxID=383855 RepID=M2ZT60_PSEFD|nr:uncharacterized protein MYCFIDRAFT_139273 [Pseudocercospora fijiensis CIRAD86]EME82199.1 hypothetical protein MYCFIDRAFT_139273 [Pseudocercospora fijiensis CIRAD86]